MKSAKLITFIIILFITGCATPGYREATVKVSPNLSIIPADISSLMPPPKPESPAVIELVVTDYSEGAETIRITDDGITEGFRDGWIQILVKVRIDNKLKESRMIEARGKGREEILANLKKILYENFSVRND